MLKSLVAGYGGKTATPPRRKQEHAKLNKPLRQPELEEKPERLFLREGRKYNKRTAAAVTVTDIPERELTALMLSFNEATGLALIGLARDPSGAIDMLGETKRAKVVLEEARSLAVKDHGLSEIEGM